MARGFYWDADGSFDWDFRPAPRHRGGATAAVLPAPRQGLVRVAAQRPATRATSQQAGLPVRAVLLAALTLAAIVVGLAVRAQLSRGAETPRPTPAAAVPPAPAARATAIQLGSGAPQVAASPGPAIRRATPAPIEWRQSRSLGLPWAGVLVNGVRLPAEGATYFTWDSALERSPSREWRRVGTDRLVRTLLAVLAEYHRAHPGAPRVGIGDLSRPHGGPFGRRFGGLGHVSHQNGLDVDVYYPRLDGREAEPTRPSQIDRVLAQDLVDRFVRAGAQFVFVGPNTQLRGPSGIVQKLVYHDDHMHVRIRPAGQ